MSLEFGESQRVHIRTPNGEFGLEDIDTVWNRRIFPSVPATDLSEDDRNFVVRECHHVVAGLWHMLADRFWVNPYDPARAGEHKPYQLKVAQAVGLRVPKTIMTNHPERALEFFDECHAEIVYKTLSGYARLVGKTQYGLYTSPVSRDDLEARLSQVAASPCIFQERIPKKVEIRINVIGDAVFAAAIDSQQDERTRVDWRRNILNQLPSMCPIELPQAVSSGVRELMNRMELVFGCIDMIQTPDNEFVFLEINPGGQWHWVEAGTGQPLAAALARCLALGRRSLSVGATVR